MTKIMRIWAPAMLSVTANLLANQASALGVDDDFHISVGVKTWISDWDSWYRTNVFYGSGSIQFSEPVDSNTRPAFIPNLSLTYKSFLLSGSYLASQDYSLAGSRDNFTASRSEYDAALGYYVIDGLAVTAGYKQISQDYGGGAFKWRGPTIGFLPSANLKGNWGVYGVASYGLFKLNVPQALSDAANATSFNASYGLVEAGLSYGVFFPQIIEALRITVGYRAQILTTKGYKLKSADALGNATTPAPYEHDDTYGPTIGISATF